MLDIETGETQMTNQTLIANAMHVAKTFGGSTDPKVIVRQAINGLKLSRNRSQNKAKWQAAIDVLEATNATH